MSPTTLIFPFFTTEPFLPSTHQQYQEQYGFTPITISPRWRQTLNTTRSLSTQTQKPELNAQQQFANSYCPCQNAAL